MTGARSIVVVVGTLLVLGRTSVAQVGREVIMQGKAATALVQFGSGREETTATAFCVDASGLFVTNAHVVRSARPGTRIKLVLRSAEEDQKIVTAELYRRDDRFDLALLKADPVEGVTALPMGRDQDLFETLATTTFGYPFGSVLAFQREGYPSISINVQRISSLRKKGGELVLIQIDGQLNPGNSGGPLLGPDGKVIGVALATVKGSGINFAIPVGRLARFLAAPGLDFDPPPLTPQNSGQPVTWTIRAIPATPTTELPADLHIAVTVTVDQGKPRTFEARSSAARTYEVTLTLVPDDTAGRVSPRAVEAVVEAKQGTTLLASVQRRTELAAPQRVLRIGPRTVVIQPAPGTRGMAGRGPEDEGLLKVGGTLDVQGVPRGAGASIRPPAVTIDAAPVGTTVATEGEIRRFVGHGNVLWGVAASPDGRRLMTSSHDYTVRVWDVETGRQLRVLNGHTDHVKGVAFLPDGRRGLSGADDDTLRLWDLESGRELRQFIGHTADLFGVAVSPDGRRALSCANDRTARLWDIESGRELHVFRHEGEVSDAAFLPDGLRALTSAADGTVWLWELETGRELRRFGPVPKPARLALAPDGRIALVGGGDGIIRLLEVATWQEVGRLVKHDDDIAALAFTPDGRRALSSSWKDPTVRIWDLTTCREVRRIHGINSTVADIAVLPDGRSAALAVHDRTARLYGLEVPDEPKDASLVRMLDGKIGDVVSGGGGRYLILTLKDARKLAIFDVNAADVVKAIPLRSENVLVAAGAKVLCLTFPDENVIERWDLGSLTPQGDAVPLPIKGRLRGLALGSDSDGPLLVAWAPETGNPGIDQARFSFLDLANLTVLKVGPLTTGGFQGLASVSPSGGSFLLHPFLRERLHIRASAGGGLFAIWQTRASPTGFQTLVVNQGAIRAVYNHNALDPLTPGADGRTIYTSQSGPLDPDGKPVGPSGQPAHSGSVVTIPTADPAFYLAIEVVPPQWPRRLPGPSLVSVSVHLAGKGTRLFTLRRGLDEMSGVSITEPTLLDDFSVEKRFHFVPAANLLITIPPASDRLVLRNVDIGKSLSRIGDDSLVVTSPGALTADGGQSFHHRVEARSRTGALRYAVALGPDGLSVSPEGELRWNVPAESKGRDETVVVSVADGAGAERFHLIRIAVR
jgi:WD40 repeat protein